MPLFGTFSSVSLVQLNMFLASVTSDLQELKSILIPLKMIILIASLESPHVLYSVFFYPFIEIDSYLLESLHSYLLMLPTNEAKSAEAVRRYQRGRDRSVRLHLRMWGCGSSAANRCWRKQGHGENRGWERDRPKQSRVDNPPADQTDTVIPSRQWIIQGSLSVWSPDTRTNLLLVETFGMHIQQLFTGADLVFVISSLHSYDADDLMLIDCLLHLLITLYTGFLRIFKVLSAKCSCLLSNFA